MSTLRSEETVRQSSSFAELVGSFTKLQIFVFGLKPTVLTLMVTSSLIWLVRARSRDLPSESLLYLANAYSFSVTCSPSCDYSSQI